MRIFLIIPLLLLMACSGFDKAVWASGKGNYEGKNPRIAMVNDAQHAGVKVGATRSAVRSLLGEPDSSGPNGDIWYLGRSTYAPDYQTFEVIYDDKGIVTKAGSTQS
jgi:outer membrane protein assembly factor BamE (lipoprotein component of BamABCDE complex)